MVPRINKPNLFQLASRRWSQRTPAAQTRCPAPFHSGAFAPAAILGLLTLPAAAAGLDPAKVNADATAQRTLEAIDAAHHLQSLGTLAHYVLAADAQGQTCTLEDKGNDIFMMECAPAPQHPKYSLLLTGENGRLLAVSMYGADSHLLPTGDAFERLTAVATVQPEVAAITPAPQAAPEASFYKSSIHDSVNTDRCIWTSAHSMKVPMGSLYPLENFVKQVGGRCTMDETKGGEMEISCQFPDFKTHKLHALLLQGDGDGADCYGVTHIAFDGKILPYDKYVQIFVDHK